MTPTIDGLENVERYPLSDSDIRKIIGSKTKIIKFSQLANYNSIEQLLPHNGDYLVLLFESAMDSGHWTALLRYNDTIEFFGSYGGEPHDILRWTSQKKKKRRSLGEDEDYLTEMFDRTELPVIIILSNTNQRIMK